MMISYLLQLLLATPQAIEYGFFVAGLGALLALSFHIAFGAVRALPSFGLYLKLHSQAVLLSAGSIVVNFILGKKTPLKIVPFDATSFSLSRVVIIPGTWSHRRYDWDRWQTYVDELQQGGHAVYKFQWYASNSVKSRQEAAKFLREWLDKECEGVQNVILIGHSYGGIVAALVAEHHLVSDVVTIAAPFVSTGELKDEQIASGALALVTRAFLLPTIIWLVYTASTIYRANGVVGITQLRSGWDIYVFSAGLGCFIVYFLYVVIRLRLAMARPALNISVPATNGTSVICVQVNGDTIVGQLTNSAGSHFTQAESSQTFLKQDALQRHAIRRWALPYYLLCVLSLAHVYAFPKITIIFEVLAAHKNNFTLLALQGYFLFIVYVISIRTLAGKFPALRNIKDLLAGLSQMVDWDAMARDNRRSVICLLAGLPLHARLVHSLDISADIPGATIWQVDVPKSLTGLHKHSDVIEDEKVTLKVIGLLCSPIKQASPCRKATSQGDQPIPKTARPAANNFD